MNYIQDNKEMFNKAIEFFKHDILSLRTGRASSVIVEDIQVEAYGVRQPLKAVASITIQDARTIGVEPWDKSIMGAVESALRAAPIGINPVNDGRLIRLPLPELTQDRRKELVKVLSQKMEAARVSIRKVREEVKEFVELAEEGGEIGEDEKFKQLDELEKVVKEYNDKIKEIGEEKETEINTI